MLKQQATPPPSFHIMALLTSINNSGGKKCVNVCVNVCVHVCVCMCVCMCVCVWALCSTGWYSWFPVHRQREGVHESLSFWHPLVVRRGNYSQPELPVS